MACAGASTSRLSCRRVRRDVITGAMTSRDVTGADPGTSPGTCRGRRSVVLVPGVRTGPDASPPDVLRRRRRSLRRRSGRPTAARARSARRRTPHPRSTGHSWQSGGESVGLGRDAVRDGNKAAGRGQLLAAAADDNGSRRPGAIWRHICQRRCARCRRRCVLLCCRCEPRGGGFVVLAVRPTQFALHQRPRLRRPLGRGSVSAARVTARRRRVVVDEERTEVPAVVVAVGR